MFTNKDILNIMLNNGMDYVMNNVSMKNVQDEEFRKLLQSYLDLRKKMVQHIIDSVSPETKSTQIELELK